MADWKGIGAAHCQRRALALILLLAPIAQAQYVQQAKLIGSGAVTSGAGQGSAVALSTDGNTAVIGGQYDGAQPAFGAGWVFTRSNGAWTQQGSKLTPTSTTSGPSFAATGVAISADTSTIILGGDDYSVNYDINVAYYPPAAWVYTRNGPTWSQRDEINPGNESQPPGSSAAVSLSNDGNTVVVGAGTENNYFGAVRVYSRTGVNFSSEYTLPYGTAAQPAPSLSALTSQFGLAVAISGDGNTMIVGGPGDHGAIGAAWIYIRGSGNWTQQGGKLTAGDAAGSTPFQGGSVAISSDGNTAVVGGSGDGNSGAAWVYVRTNGQWSQQGPKLVGSGAVGNAMQGVAVAISADGNTILVGGSRDNNKVGAAWVFTRSNGVWSQKGNKLVATSAIGAAQLGASVAMSAEGNTVLLGAPNDNGTTTTQPGAAFIFVPSPSTGTSPGSVSPTSGTAMSQVLTAVFNDPNGWQDLDVVNILINNFLDGRNSCYLAYSRSANVLYLVANDGGTLMGLPVNGSGSVSNTQCTVNGASTSASGNGNTLTLAVNLAFTGTYAGNKIIYTAARDLHGGNSGWQALGVWNIPGASTFPTALSATPARGSGLTQSFTFTFSDTKGATDLGVVNVLINNFLDGRSACYIAYSQPYKVLYLVGDAGGGLSAGLTLGGSGSVSNGQCTINASGSSATLSGNMLTLVLNMSFAPAFDGNRVIYTAARDSTDANNSGWQSLGTWTVQ